jgi:2-keto-4-pentenoate hydratase/2-oxohepta-3-ene-1,7-dioic acid hydratase in catechol pathway
MFKPSKIICVGLNYKQHAAELKMALPKEPVIFLKPLTSLIFDNDQIVYPAMSQEVHYEAELGIVLGKQCKNVAAAEAKNYIAGYVCSNDVTARDLQRRDGQWTRAKSFDTFCPVSKNIVPAATVDPNRLAIRARLNGRVVQESTTADMIFNVYDIVAFVSQVMTLYPEDLILTGTPEGVGPMQVGDEITIEIENIGTLTNTVVC